MHRARSGVLVYAAACMAFHLFAGTVQGAPSKPKPSVSDLESKQLCSGGQLKPSITNPTCQGWVINNFTNLGSPEATFYNTNYPDSCTKDSTGSVFCAFPGADTTCTDQDTAVSCKAKQSLNQARGKVLCQAYADATGSLATTIPADKKPYCGTGASGNTGYYRCAWCQKGESGCAPGSTGKGKYIPGEVCSGGSTVFPFDTVPDSARHSYCSTPVSGPYRNHADSYMACGATQTQTYPGMIFTSNQRAQIIAINKAANGNQLKSDLRGFCYPRTGNAPCAKAKRGNPDICIEPDVLNEFPGTSSSAQVHHIVPKKDRRSCPCGANTMKNAAVISQRLNAHFTNKNRNTFISQCSPMQTEVEWVNALPAL